MTKTHTDTSLEWRDFYEIGVDFIDNEHRELLSIMRSIGHAVDTGDFAACVKQADILINAVRQHFMHEESYLEKVNFPRLDEHKRYHEELLRQVHQVKTICEGAGENHSLNECFDAMKNFLIDDVLRGDIDFKSYLEYNGHISRKLR